MQTVSLLGIIHFTWIYRTAHLHLLINQPLQILIPQYIAGFYPLYLYKYILQSLPLRI